MAVATFTRTFSAAHRIAGDEGVCHRIHGHNYLVEITVETLGLDDNGFTVPADKIKDVVDRKYDHRLLLDKDDPLTLARRVPLTGFQEDEGRTRLEGMPEDTGWVVRIDGPPSTERLAYQIATDVRDLDPRITDVGVTLYETATIAASVNV
jgi:6-pyruvoyl-tetrahydropterin synthase